MRSLRLACGVLLLALVGSSLSAGPRHWTLDGPYAADLRDVAFDPSDSQIALAAAGIGVFRSTDGGRTWKLTNLRGTVYDLASSADGQRIYAASLDGLYLSTDHGLTWNRLDPSSSFAVTTSADGRVAYFDSDDGIRRTTDGGVTFGEAVELNDSPDTEAIVLDPQNNDVAWAIDSFEGVYRTTNGGAQWAPASTGLDAEFYSALLFDPTTRTLYAGSSDGLFKSTDSAATWTLVPGTSFFWYRSLDLNVGPPSLLIAGMGGGVQLTSDGGATWTEQKLASAPAVAIDPRNRANILVASSGNLFRSTDGGLGYSLANSGMTAFETESIAVDPRNAATVYTAGEAGIFRSTDRGRNWSPVVSTVDSPNGPASLQILVDPFDSDTLYASTYEGDLLRTEDGGATWTNISRGLPGDVELVALDPQTQGVIYVFSNDSIYKKTGGGSWVNSSGLPDDLFPIFITVDPHDSSTIYTGGQEHLYRSTNGGASWLSSRTGIGTDEFLGGLSIDPFDSNHLFTWGDRTYESTDRGASWKVVDGVEENNGITFDPVTRNFLYANGYGSFAVSRNGGQSWTPLEGGNDLVDSMVFAVAADGKTLYAGGIDSGVWVWDYRTSRRRAVR